MELRHLRYFLAVAEELHFHRAATRLHISQPPLSQQIRALERELGVTLLERNRRRVALTAAGEVFRDDARAILAAVERASERAQNIARGSLGTLSIGFVGSAMFSPTLPDLLREFRSGRPEVELVLRELPTVVQLQALVGGELDVGVIRGPIAASELDPQLELMTIQRERLVAALPADHPLAARRRLRAADLRGETFVILARREAPGLFASLSAAMGEVGGVPDDVLEVAEMQTIISLVAGGFGVSLVPASVGSVDRSGVAFRQFVGPAPTIELSAAWRTGGGSPVRDAFLALARASKAPSAGKASSGAKARPSAAGGRTRGA
jgi:DNA-binding transcriptional LysR family regulator